MHRPKLEAPASRAPRLPRPPSPAIQRWDGEGGAAEAMEPHESPPHAAGAEEMQLRARVIALEGLVLALLVQSSAPQRIMAARMAEHILPRPGRTPHGLTIRAAARIHQLVVRARRIAALR